MSASCTHVAIHSRDLERSIDFYRRYAGLVEVHRRTDGSIAVVWLGEKGHERRFVIVLLAMDHADAVVPAPMAHLGYAVESRAEVDRLAALASDEGVLAQGPMDAGPIVGYFCILTDPDGNSVEFSHGQSLGDAA
jgi:catechol 2,3-dioxygenase-like lactoylglutathione lyase family enzyme